MKIKKTVLSSTLAAALVIGGVVHAEENSTSEIEIVEHYETPIITPEFELYETIRIIEEIEYELTEDVTEKILLQDEYADKRLAELEEMVEVGLDDKVEELLEDYEKHMEEVEKNLEEAREEGTDLTDLEDVISDKKAKRFENLLLLLEREDLPEQAKTGVSKAIANKQRAMERSGKLQRRGLEGLDQKEIVVEEEMVVVEDMAVVEEVELQGNRFHEQEEKRHEKITEKIERKQEQLERRQEKVEEKVERKQEQIERRQEKTSERSQRQTEKAEQRNGNGRKNN